MIPSIKRGDIFYADLSPVIGSEQGGLRPVLIIQNDVGNRHSPTVIAAAITSKTGKSRLPTHIDIYAEAAGLVKDSVILLEQIRTLDKRRLKEKAGHLTDMKMGEVDNAIAVSLSLLGAVNNTGHNAGYGAEHNAEHNAEHGTGRGVEHGQVHGGEHHAAAVARASSAGGVAGAGTFLPDAHA